MKQPIGTSKKDVILSDGARLASTPFPCGKCLFCRINQGRVWKHRILLEQLSHPDSAFITLTYDIDHVPIYENQEDWKYLPTLEPKDVTDFMKRLRWLALPRKLRYFFVGEYGKSTWRPHYHAAIFGINMIEQKLVEKAWKKGFIQIGDLNEKSAGYITGYLTKSMMGFGDKRLMGRFPEFKRASQGLGKGYIDKIIKRFTENTNLKPEIIKTFKVGKKNMPLGRYLTKRLCDGIGITEGEWAKHVSEYQDKIFEDHLESIDGIKNSILRESFPKRKSIQKKHNIFKQRRTL